jgi:hypothetical protein
LHHATVLELVLDAVGVVWKGLLKNPLEVICRCPQPASVAMRDGQDLSHTRTTCLPAVVIDMAGHGHSPYRALLTPLVAAIDAILGAISNNVRRCLLVPAQGRFPAPLCRAVHDHLVVGGVLSGDVARLLAAGFARSD